MRNPDYTDYDITPLNEMSGHAYTLALAGYISGDQRFSDRAALSIRTFLLDPATRMNPDMEHDQLIRGENTGRHAGLLEGRRFMDVIDAIGLLEKSQSSWTTSDDKAVRAWFKQFVDWMQNGDMKKESDAPNNHGTWFDVQVVTFHLFLGDKAGAKKVLEKAKTKRIAKEIEPNGDEPKELVRTKSLSYSAFNLLALAELANLGERAGVDLWHYQTDDGRSIRAVIDSLLPYVTGEKHWPHQQIVKFDASIMPPILERAAKEYNDPSYAAAARKIEGKGKDLQEASPGTKF